MSRTQKRSNNAFPSHPITAYGYMDKEAKEIVVKNAGSELDPENKGLRIPFVSKLNEGDSSALSSCRLILLEKTFAKSYYNEDTRFFARSTEYRSKGKDKIAVFGGTGGGHKLMSCAPENAPMFDSSDKIVEEGDSGKYMSTTMNLYVYSPGLDIAFRLEMTATQRRGWFLFMDSYKKEQKRAHIESGSNEKLELDLYPCFTVFDLVPPTESQIKKDPKVKKSWRFPVFNVHSFSNSEDDIACMYSERLDEYFHEHPDFWNDEDEKESSPVETKVSKPASSEDEALEEHLKNLPTVDPDTENDGSDMEGDESENEDPSIIEDVNTDGVFEDTDIPPVSK